jgi:hypothetical protein
VSALLRELDVAGERDSWEAAGFAVDDHGAVRVGQVALQTGVGTSGIGGWRFADGDDAPDAAPVVHPNGAIVLDHLVVMTEDPSRTTATYGELGWEPRRVRELGNGSTQTFFRTGEVIIELIGPNPAVHTEQLWGLAYTVTDLDACALLLGEKLGRIKDAVQPGRRIATVRHEACGLTVPIAFMSE